MSCVIDFACRRISREDLLRCSFSLSRTEYKVLSHLLLLSKPKTVSLIAAEMGLERTTIQKALKVLVEKSLVLRKQSNLDKGGYEFFYFSLPKEEIKKIMYANVGAWQKSVLTEIDSL